MHHKELFGQINLVILFYVPVREKSLRKREYYLKWLKSQQTLPVESIDSQWLSVRVSNELNLQIEPVDPVDAPTAQC